MATAWTNAKERVGENVEGGEGRGCGREEGGVVRMNVTGLRCRGIELLRRREGERC